MQFYNPHQRGTHGFRIINLYTHLRRFTFFQTHMVVEDDLTKHYMHFYNPHQRGFRIINLYTHLMRLNLFQTHMVVEDDLTKHYMQFYNHYFNDSEISLTCKLLPTLA